MTKKSALATGFTVDLTALNEHSNAQALLATSRRCYEQQAPSRKLQATSNKLQAPSIKHQAFQASSSKHQAPSNKHQAPSRKQQAARY